MAVGFLTPSKLKNEQIDLQRRQAQNSISKLEMMLQANRLSEFILSENFVQLAPKVKKRVLEDFSHISGLLNSV